MERVRKFNDRHQKIVHSMTHSSILFTDFTSTIEHSRPGLIRVCEESILEGVGGRTVTSS